jgi:predicted DNA-binding transcriptional regulator AlpA
MTPQEAERRARQRADSERQRDDMRVIRWKDWYQSKGISKATAGRLRKKGLGPRITEVGVRAIGVTVADDRAWTEARSKGGA